VHEQGFLFGDLTERIIGAAIEVHRSLGPGFIEAFYESAFAIELSHQGVPFRRQLSHQVSYKGVEIGIHRIDLIVDEKVVVELKALRQLDDIHTAILLSYLKASGTQVGLIINFAAPTVRVKRVARTTGKITAEFMESPKRGMDS
jgi:GxxExxY protein